MEKPIKNYGYANSKRDWGNPELQEKLDKCKCPIDHKNRGSIDNGIREVTFCKKCDYMYVSYTD
jgi:hypothetical protein